MNEPKRGFIARGGQRRAAIDMTEERKDERQETDESGAAPKPGSAPRCRYVARSIGHADILPMIESPIWQIRI
ncbi:hypothetical protein [Afifella pfennigii]|uniref:hypothetical protein n=1 Tax=Afifella pfennigii TaxID=209897 RepID=UPI0012EB573C|nr:hypothetical protein [Afifella pfennigii]